MQYLCGVHGTKYTKSPPRNVAGFFDDGGRATIKDEELSSERRLKNVIRRTGATCNPESLIHVVYDEVVAFVGDTEQSDDITLFAIKYKPLLYIS